MAVLFALLVELLLMIALLRLLAELLVVVMLVKLLVELLVEKARAARAACESPGCGSAA